VTQVDHEFARLEPIEFIEKLSPAFTRPDHLTDWLELIRQAAHHGVRGLCSIPIRHWKTESSAHGLVWLLLQDPSRRVMFLTHSYEAATKWAKRIRQLAEAMDHLIGVSGTVGPARGWNTIAEWRNNAGGGVVVMSADQSKIGYDCHVLLIDDPIDEFGAQDQKKRDEVDESIIHYTARCVRDGVPGPVLIVASRFHPDDPTGRRLMRTQARWEYVHHAALKDEGLPTERAFAPKVWDLPALKAVRAELAEKDPGERLWWAQFQNDPKPVGSDLFRDPTYWTKMPDWNFRLAYGADLAFTQGEHSDYFAMVAMKICGRKAYVLEVQRHKLDAHMIESTSKAMLAKFGYGPIYSYMSGPEIGMARLMRERGIPFVSMRARYNKLVRAERTIRRWNDGDIAIPADAPWLRGFLHRVSCFRGNDSDSGDDEIDALVSVCDGAMGGIAAGGVKTMGKAYSGMYTR
jgi:predicted phage terminase large subunit-like protein